MLMEEYRKFKSKLAKMPKDAWKVAERQLTDRNPNPFVTACERNWSGVVAEKLYLIGRTTGFVEVIVDEHCDPNPTRHLQGL